MGRNGRVKKPPYVAIDHDRHGNERIYFRQPGSKKIRLRGPLFSDEFWKDYQAARSGKLAPRPVRHRIDEPGKGSFHALCVAYYRSAEYKRLSPRSRYVRKLLLDGLCGKYGDKPAQRLERRHILQWRDAKAETPAAANMIVKALRQLYRFALLYELADRNPALEVPYLPSANREGFHQWTPDEIAKYEAHHRTGTQARLAFDLMVYTGQRRGDVILWGPQHIRDGRLVFRQQKTGRRLEIPIHPMLADSIRATSTSELAFLLTKHGSPWANSNSFGNRMRRWCDAAELPECSAHGLRKVTASRLAEIGCAAHEIMAITGHDSLKEIERYTRGRDQIALADRAMTRYAAASFSKPIVSPANAVQSSETNPTDNPLTEKEAGPWMVPRGGIEPPTRGFSIRCSTD